MQNITYLSDNVQNCLNDLFSIAYNKKNDDFMESILEISSYLMSKSNEYDDVLNKYEGVSKSLLNQMILSNFLEITYYRRKNGIKLDDVRLNIFNSLETSNSNNNGLMSLLYCDMQQFATMVNDVLLYFWYPFPMYSYNIVKSMSEDGFAKKLYAIYPLAHNEHILTLDYSCTEKEFLLYTLIETMITATERLTFSNGNYPIPNAGYFQDIANKLKKHNGSNPTLPNLHKEVLEEFNTRVGISKGNNYNKILLLEILLSTVQAKNRCFIPESKDEKQIIETLNKTNFTLEDLSSLYDNNEEQIISSLINDWNMFPNEIILSDVECFETVKEQGVKTLNKVKKDDSKH